MVSIIVPVFNRLFLLKHAVRSVLRQAYFKWELLVVDDGSSDGTNHWLLMQQKRYPRIRLIIRSNYRPTAHGAQVCRNLGLQMAQGDGVLFLDSDDLLDSDCLRRRVALLEANPALDAVVGQALRFQDQPGDLGNKTIWGQWSACDDDLDRFLVHDIPWQTSGPLWRRSALDRLGYWDEQLQYVGHDHEFHVRALCRGLRFLKQPVVDYFWRVPRADSLSSLESFKSRHSDGGMITAYRAIMAEVMRSGGDTPYRRRLMAGEVIRLASNCRNFAGTASQAEQGLLDACRLGLFTPWTTQACRLLLRCWWRIGGRVPAMALLNRLANQVASV